MARSGTQEQTDIDTLKNITRLGSFYFEAPPSP